MNDFVLDDFLQKIISLKRLNKKTDKRNYLKSICTNNRYKKILELSLSPHSPMYVGEETTLKKIEEAKEVEYIADLDVLMEELASQKINRGSEAFGIIKYYILNNCATEEEKEICLSLIKKNPRLGVSWHSFTKVNNVNKFEVMLAKDINKVKNLDKKILFPVYVQPKLDGYRCVAIYDKKWKLYSRNGKEYENFSLIIEELKKHGDKNLVYDGEIMSNDFQAMQKTAFSVKNKKTVGDVWYRVFDCIEKKDFINKISKTTFIDRFNQMKDSLLINKKELKSNKLIPVECIPANTWDKVYIFHEDFKSEGYEGSIVRNDTVYEFKRTDNLIKIKDMKSQDCIIHQVIEGRGKYKNMMGAIRVLQEDGQTLCETGTGFTDTMRKEFWELKETIIGRVVEIKYQELTSDGVMRFPVFIRFRNDKE